MKVHKNTTGKSLLCQLTKVMKNRGLVVISFWWNNTTTMTDSFGYERKWVHPNRETMREVYSGLISKGYTPVTQETTV